MKNLLILSLIASKFLIPTVLAENEIIKTLCFKGRSSKTDENGKITHSDYCRDFKKLGGGWWEMVQSTTSTQLLSNFYSDKGEEKKFSSPAQIILFDCEQWGFGRAAVKWEPAITRYPLMSLFNGPGDFIMLEGHSHKVITEGFDSLLVVLNL